jgi:signal transduction histidine kinase
MGGRCCGADALDAAAPLLADRDVLLVFDDGGALVAARSRALDPATISATNNDGRLTVTGRAEGPGLRGGMSIVLSGVPPVRVTLENERPANLFVVEWSSPDGSDQRDVFLGSVDRRLIVAVATIGTLALLVTWAVARRIGGPVAELHRATADVARGDFSRRVPADGHDELADLGRAFNQMSAELERQQHLRRNLAQDVAHELRTPLTSLRCRLETILDGLSPDPRPSVALASEDVAHLSQLVADLEELARAEAGDLTLSITDVSVADVLVSAVRAAGLEADPRLTIDADPSAIARADTVRVRQVLLNLLTNADRHTPEGGRITARVRQEGDHVGVTIVNTGSTLTEADRARVFDRFYRADPSRQRATGGSGLGLAIVKHLVDAQHGRVSVSSEPDQVEFSVYLPAL